jgi:hypothetical protein
MGAQINVTRLADERQTRGDEIKLHRDLALKLIDLLSRPGLARHIAVSG